LSVDADTTAAQAKIAALAGPVRVEIDSSQVQEAIAQVQSEISNSFAGGAGGDGGIGGQGGQGGQGGNATADFSSIQSTLNGWTQIFSTIRDRLPLTALAA
jgi:hypothetical protein